MGVVVEPLEEALAHVLVDERVHGDLMTPGVVLGGVGQLAVEQQVGHLEIGRLLGQLLDRVAAVAQNAVLSVDHRDGTGAEGGGRQPGVVEPDPGQQLLPLRRVDAPMGDRDLELVACPVVDDGDALGHDARILLLGVRLRSYGGWCRRSLRPVSPDAVAPCWSWWVVESSSVVESWSWWWAPTRSRPGWPRRRHRRGPWAWR